MGSSSATSQSSKTITTDQRQALDNGAIAAGAGSVLTVNTTSTPDQAFAMGTDVINVLASVIKQKQGQTMSAAQLTDTLIKFGLPVAALVFIFGGK